MAFVYPRTGTPGQPLVPGWDDIPGRARLHAAELRVPRPPRRAERPGRLRRRQSARWTRASRRAFAEREQLPYPLLNDGPLLLRDALGLPTFDVCGTTLYKRLTFVARAGRIEKVFYPVFPPRPQRGRGGGLAARAAT